MQNINLNAYKKQRILLSEAEQLAVQLNKLYSQNGTYEEMRKLADRLDEITIAYNELSADLHTKCS